MSLVDELKRRNVFRVGIAYLVLSWLILQVVDVIAPLLDLPDWAPKLVLLIVAIGFIPALVFAWVYELTPEGLKKESEIDASRSITHHTARKLDQLTIALLVLVIALIAIDRYAPGRVENAPIPASKTVDAGQEPADDEVSIAVLPFANMSADPEQEYFSDGISEELLNVLAQFPGLRVAARTSSFQFKGQNRDIGEIGRQLRVNHVLEGSVRKAGNRLRITAQLIDAGSGFHLWSASWDRELEDIFAIQNEISNAIGDALQIELDLQGGESAAALPSVPAAASAQAYEYYLRGRQLINGRSRAGLEEAVTALERVLELDETYAPAHAQLAIAIALLKQGSGSYGDLSLDEVRERATPHVQRALELSPELADAYAAKALLAMTNYDYATAIENSNQAIARNPSYIDVINWLYLAQINSGRWTEAVETMDNMMSVDPLSIVGRVNYSYLLARFGHFAEAREVASGLARQSAGASYLAHALISADYTGDIADSVGWYLRSLALDPGNLFARERLAGNLAAVGEYDEARQIAPGARWRTDAIQQRWRSAVALARQRLADTPEDNLLKMRYANVMHMSGDLPAAQALYEELFAATNGFPIIDPSNSAITPTARLAYGRLAAGDSEGAREVLNLISNELRARERAGIRESYMSRVAAMVAAMENDRAQVLQHLNAAVDLGLRDHSIFREPVFHAYRNDSEFLVIVRRLDTILAAERIKTVQLICFDNPARDVWQPLVETCSEVLEPT